MKKLNKAKLYPLKSNTDCENADTVPTSGVIGNGDSIGQMARCKPILNRFTPQNLKKSSKSNKNK